MDNYIKNPKYKSILAFFCAFGWSLAYPLIKIGYEQFAIPSSDLGGKIIFAGVRFFFAEAGLTFVIGRCHVCDKVSLPEGLSLHP